jgi:hypothetical protein
MKRSVISLISLIALVCLMLIGSAYAGDHKGDKKGKSAYAGDKCFDREWDGRDRDRDRDRDGWWEHHEWCQYLTKINQRFMITPQEAFDWNAFKAQQGPTYAGSPGWAAFVKFVEDKMDAYGIIDKAYIDIPYNHYVVNDWPDPRTHQTTFAGAVEKLVSDGTAVPVVAGYGMTSGYTDLTGTANPVGITKPMIYYDPANPPTPAAMAGKIVVFQTVPYTAAVPGLNGPYSYTNSFLDSYTFSDSEYQSPGNWYPMYTPPPPSVTSNYYYRWVWGQLGGFATIGQNANAAGMVVVYDFSPGGALGVTQRSVYTKNVPTLTLDRVNGAKVITDAKAGKTATLTLVANFQIDHGKAIIGYLPGKNYGTPQDEQVMLSSHADAMSLVEENGALGLLGVLHYFKHIPQSERPRTLVIYLDCRHFMPGGESAWPQYDYYLLYPEKLKPIVATVGFEHMGARTTIETGPGGNVYEFSKKGPNSGGLGTSLIDLNNNNLWLIEKIKQAAEDNHWPRVEAKAGRFVEPGVKGGMQGSVKSAVNKGRSYTPQIPGFGLAGDWPGCCTQTYAQMDTEAGYPGIDKHYFVTQVAGMSQMIGELMLVEPIVIDLGWGQLKSGLVCTAKTFCDTQPVSGYLPDTAFTTPANAPAQREALLDLYEAAFRRVEHGEYDEAMSKLQHMKAKITAWIVSPTALNAVIDGQIAKLPAE